MKRLALVSVLLVGACQKDAADEMPEPPELSETYEKVDWSFSGTAIDTSYAELDLPDDLSAICEEWSDCEWQDDEDVRHAIWGQDTDSLRVVVKSVSARDFEGRPIPALGIGEARRRDEVIEKVEAFLGGAELDCVSGDAIESCGTEVLPGWITVDFDTEGRLLKAKFDGLQPI